MPTLRTMTPTDYDAVLALMQSTPGISLRDADARDATERYLRAIRGSVSWLNARGD